MRDARHLLLPAGLSISLLSLRISLPSVVVAGQWLERGGGGGKGAWGTPLVAGLSSQPGHCGTEGGTGCVRQSPVTGAREISRARHLKMLDLMPPVAPAKVDLNFLADLTL